MEIFQYASLAAAAFLIVLLSRHLLRYGYLCEGQRKKQFPPSPPSRPIIGHLHLLKLPRHLSIAALAKRYGPIVFLRLGTRPALIVSSPEIAEEVLSKHDTIFSNHPAFHAGKVLCYNNTSMFVSPYGPHWRNLRRITVVKLLSMSHINKLAAVRAQELHCLFRRVVRGAVGGRGEVDLKGRLFEMTFNATSKMVVGRRFYGEDVAAAEAADARRFRQIIAEGLQLRFSFNPRDYFPALGWLDLTGVEKKMVRLRPMLDGFMTELVEDHRSKRRREATVEQGGGEEAMEGWKTLLDVMLSLQETDPETYPDDLIKGHIMILLTAGSDTTAQTAAVIMLLLLCHQEIMNKVRKEIDSTILEPSRILDESDLPKLPYLHCVVKEALRLVMPMQGMPPRASSEDCTINGYHVPRGTMVFVNTWGIQRDPNLWDDPMTFKPERFHGHEGWTDKFRYLPFGVGRRRCPGDNLGVRMVAFTVGCLVQCFDWDPMTAEEVGLNDLIMGLTTRESKLAVARYSVRESMIHAFEI